MIDVFFVVFSAIRLLFRFCSKLGMVLWVFASRFFLNDYIIQIFRKHIIKTMKFQTVGYGQERGSFGEACHRAHACAVVHPTVFHFAGVLRHSFGSFFSISSVFVLSMCSSSSSTSIFIIKFQKS